MSEIQGLLQTQAEEIAKLSLLGVDPETITDSQIDGIARAIAPEIIRGFAQGIRSELLSTIKDVIKMGISNKQDDVTQQKIKNINNRPVKLNTKESSKLLENSEKHTGIFEKQLGFLETISKVVQDRVNPSVTVIEKHVKENKKENPKNDVEKSTLDDFKINSFDELGSKLMERMFKSTGIPTLVAKITDTKKSIYEKSLESVTSIVGMSPKDNQRRDLHERAKIKLSEIKKEKKLKEKEERLNAKNNPIAESISNAFVRENKEENTEDNKREDAQANVLKKIEENTRKLSTPNNTNSLFGGQQKNNDDGSMIDRLLNFVGLGKGKGGKSPIPVGFFGKASKFVGRVATPLMIAMSALSLNSDLDEINDAKDKGLVTDKEATNKKGGAWGKAIGSVAGGLTGRWAGATAGAAIGSVVPVVGTAIGGLIGMGLGSFMGSSAGEYLGEKVTDFVGGGGSDEAKSINPAEQNTSGEVVYEKSFSDSMQSSESFQNHLNQIIAPTNNINSNSNTLVMSSPVRNIEPSISEYFRSRFAT